MFYATTGLSINIIIIPNHSLLTLLKKFLAKIGITIESANNSLFFIFNNQRINFDEKTKIKDFFKNNTNLKIMVRKTRDLIGE